MTVVEFISSLCKKTGISEEEQDLKLLLSKEELSRVEMPNKLADMLQERLLTIDSAKSNKEVQKYYHAEILDGIDKLILRMSREQGLSDQEIEELKKIDNTNKKLTTLLAKIRDRYELSKEDKEDKKLSKDDYIEEINALKNKLSQLSKEYETSIEELKKSSEEKLIEVLFDNFLKSLDYADVGNVSKEVLTLTASTLVKDAIKKNGGKLQLKDNSLQLVSSNGSDFFDTKNNKQDFKSLALSVLSENRLLKTNSPDKSAVQKEERPRTVSLPANGSYNYYATIDALIEQEKRRL